MGEVQYALRCAHQVRVDDRPRTVGCSVESALPHQDDIRFIQLGPQSYEAVWVEGVALPLEVQLPEALHPTHHPRDH
jgi:hypothetical protein